MAGTEAGREGAVSEAKQGKPEFEQPRVDAGDAPISHSHHNDLLDDSDDRGELGPACCTFFHEFHTFLLFFSGLATIIWACSLAAVSLNINIPLSSLIILATRRSNFFPP